MFRNRRPIQRSIKYFRRRLPFLLNMYVATITIYCNPQAHQCPPYCKRFTGDLNLPSDTLFSPAGKSDDVVCNLSAGLPSDIPASVAADIYAIVYFAQVRHKHRTRHIQDSRTKYNIHTLKINKFKT